MSSNSVEFPVLLKHTPIRPLPIPNVDQELPQNYRPVSNFSLISKLMEKPVCSEMKKYLFDINVYANYRSAYRVSHSTATAILRVHNYVMCSLDKRRDIMLITLDLSSAFDANGHEILLHGCHTMFVINGTAL